MRITQADARVLLADLNSINQQEPKSDVWFDTDDGLYHIKKRLDLYATMEQVVCNVCKGKGYNTLDKATDHTDELEITDNCLTCDGTGRL